MNKFIELVGGSENIVTFIKLISKKAIALAILIVVIWFLRMVFYKINIHFIKRRNLSFKKQETLIMLNQTIITYILCFFALGQILNIFGVNTSSFLALSSVVGLAIGLGAQDIIKDILTGILFIVEDQFNIGDFIIIEDKTGCVESINLRTTSIRGADGILHIFPNREIGYISNTTKDFSKALVKLSVAHESDIVKVLDVINDELGLVFNDTSEMLEQPFVTGISDFNESGMILKINVTCKTQSQWNVEALIRLKLKLRFDKEGLNISYPHQSIALSK